MTQPFSTETQLPQPLKMTFLLEADIWIRHAVVVAVVLHASWLCDSSIAGHI